MIEKYKDLNLTKEDKLKEIEEKLKEKLGIEIIALQTALGEFVKSKADSLVSGFRNIAPLGNYDQIIFDTDQMISFLKTEASKPEHWQLTSIEPGLHNLIEFTFHCFAIDQGENCKGFVFTDFNGKIKHVFAQGEDN